MKLEFHQLDRRYEHLRARNPDRQRRLMTSLAASGQQTPIVVIAVSRGPGRYLVIDGYKRVAALEQLGRDTVEAVVWDMSEADALVLDRSMRFSEQETALEQGWLLQEMEQRFGYSLDDLARRFDRSVSWVSRRLALVEQLPETVQQRVRTGEISAHVAMKYLAPVARANPKDCQRMADAFSKYRFNSRQAGELYAAWRDVSTSIRQRILDSPELFLKAHQQVSPQPESPADELLRDLTHLAERIEKEHDHVEPKSTNHDSGASRPGSLQTRDRPSPECVASERAQSSACEVSGIAGAGPSRESRSLPNPDLGTVGQPQREFGSGP